ncbi:hypothetical protein MMC30_003481 [Trapelia coarctata]|nr:hypothetical protein [Trapelia coarctata]
MRPTPFLALLALASPLLSHAWTPSRDGGSGIYVRDAEAEADGPQHAVNGFEGFADPGADAGGDNGADGDGAFADGD